MRKASRKLLEILAQNIQQYRTSKGFSQEELANQCGLHRTYIGSVERCERNVTLSTLELLANTLDTSVPQLLKENKKVSDE